MMNFRKWDILIIGESQLQDPDFMELLVLCGTYHKPIYLYVDSMEAKLDAQNHEAGTYLGDILVGEEALQACAKKNRICWMNVPRYDDAVRYPVLDRVGDFIDTKNRYDRKNQRMSLAVLTLGILLIIYGAYQDMIALMILGMILALIGIFIPVCCGTKGTGSILLGLIMVYNQRGKPMKLRYKLTSILIAFACTGCHMIPGSNSEHSGKAQTKQSYSTDFFSKVEIKRTRTTSRCDVAITDEHTSSKQLQLPFHFQETSYYCVPACIQMVLEYYGIYETQEVLAKELDTSAMTGTEYVDMAKVLNYHIFGKEEVTLEEAGFRIQTLSRHDRDDMKKADLSRRIKQNIDGNYPVFVAVDLKTVYPEYNVSANHMIIIHGYEMDETNTQLQSVMILDPYEKISQYNRSKLDFSILYEALILNEEPAYIY